MTQTTLTAKTHSRRRALSVASLFAGIGGFDLAFESYGAKIVAQCEIDPFCRAVLKRHWPSALLHGDIRNVEAHHLNTASVWTAGFPCQDVSLARGNHGRSGLKGHNTSLFFELARLLDQGGPEVIVLENVVGLLNSHKGSDFAVVLRELTMRGYAVAWRVLNARYFGTPQSRSRVFMVAWKDNPLKALSSLFEGTRGARTGLARTGFITPTFHKATGAIVPEVAYCVAATSGRHTGNDWARSYVSYVDKVRRPTASESERLQGFSANWTIPHPDFKSPARGLDSERYHAIGNAVAVPVVKWVANRITRIAGEKDHPGKLPKLDIWHIAPDIERRSEDLSLEHIMPQIDTGTFSYRWKGCGLAVGNDIYEGSTSSAPSTIIPSRFVDLLDDEVPDDRYFLTSNAAVGILRRADTVGRTLFAPMRNALEKLVASTNLHPTAVCGLNGEAIAKASIRKTRAEQRRPLERISSGSDRSISVDG
ncbi:DNA cytosine methyltransferase [Novosphingobium sp. AAP83]|uniref:DNA cytosine methyltransferase n=1 Tax=Novosphingobium sp. AAP83 TaxID=1523425 RepID=UPI0009E943EA|nr:DNA (cytosine-5-)-methyltransferase [Novosphingobium sp. AAP83]